MTNTKTAEDRGTWSGRLDFTMSALSFAVGMGNLWRFPYLCYRGGGGAFLIPYIIAMAVAGYPLMFIELALGQFGRQGVVSIWKACPLFQGIGWGMFAVSIFTGIYYNMIIAWCFFYMFASFASDVPWRTCDHEWNTQRCATSDVRASIACSAQNGTYVWESKSCEWSNTTVSDMDYIPGGATHKMSPISPTDEFFHKYMLELDMSMGIDDMGNVRWQLALCLLLCWVIVFFSLAKGIKVSGKVTYVTALIPYVVLLILLVRGVTLEGSLDGILYYITPQWEQLANARVWGDAAVQVFFSLSLCWGGLITLASYNKFNNDCLRDTLVVATGDMLTSIFGGFVTFSIIGFMSHELQIPISEVATQGPGLVFIVYPEGIAQLPIAPLWSILFMLMLVNVGIGSQMGIVSTVHTTLLDIFPNIFAKEWQKMVLLLGICCASFLLGLSLCTQGGMYMLALLDTYSATYAVLVLAMMECIAIAWVYGVNRFYSDIQQMIGRKISVWWKICWCFLSPAFVLFILVFIMVDFKQTRYRDYVYPVIWDVLGWMIPVVIVMCIPVTACVKIVNSTDKQLTLKQRLISLTRSTTNWGQQETQQTPKSDRSYDTSQL